VNGSTSFIIYAWHFHEDLNVKSAFIHLAADALIAAGVVIAGVLIFYTGQIWLDPAVSLLLVFVVLWNTWKLLRDSISLLLDAVPHYIDHTGIKHYLSTLSGVSAIHDLHIWAKYSRNCFNGASYYAQRLVCQMLILRRLIRS